MEVGGRQYAPTALPLEKRRKLCNKEKKFNEDHRKHKIPKERKRHKKIDNW